jgi:RNA polymerase sigma-70 factor, ECF subfamily
MSLLEKQDVTELLQEWSRGDKSALDRLIPVVYAELRRLAHQHMGREQAGHILQTTALINEVYFRLVDSNRQDWRNRAHFLAISAQLMRQILVDFARTRRSHKRSGQLRQVSLDEALTVSDGQDVDLEALHDALSALASFDQRKSRVVELRFFGGLSTEEIAAVLKVSSRTVLNDWSFAKAWLCRQMQKNKARFLDPS